MYFPEFDFESVPVCQTECDSAHGRRKADLVDLVHGLRAMVANDMPAAKPACPVAVTAILPQSTPEEHVARRAEQLKGSSFVALARCEEQAWAELSYAASNTEVWANSRALKGMPAVSSIQAISSDMDEDPDEVGLFGSTTASVVDQLAKDEELAWKMEAVRSALSDREWIAICMKAEGATRNEMAKAMEISPKAVKKALESGRAKAKAVLI